MTSRCNPGMDVRAPWDRAGGNRADSGQDYALLAQAADRLVLAEQSIGVFVGSSLPWAGGVAEVDVHVGGEAECAVLGHFGALGSLFVPLTAYRRIGMFEGLIG